ncbi:MAG: (Fe-S)-binding protein [Deltaproteobacteria bacterium]|nr:(Fe-S)-binding protein [Deltaproteobacteria bacterium]MBW2144716.1 (Fe-S)-binding protein [Deltaproteobacteria bacterium]
MAELKKTNLGEIREKWCLCMNCAACYYHGPIIPHNWLELPPERWDAPLAKCPSFEFFGFRAYTPVGRLNLATVAFGDETFPVTDDLLEVLYTCDTCGMCNEICPAYRPVDTILAFRETLFQRGAKRPAPVEKIDDNIKKTGNIFGARKVPAGEITVQSGNGKDIYFAGCNARFRKTEVIEATLETLRAAGTEIAWLGEAEQCCGFVPGHDGNTSLYEAQAARNVRMMKNAGAERIIVSCAHCLKAWKIDYPAIDKNYQFEVVHVSEIYSSLLNEGKIFFKKELDKDLTYHDPCYLGRHGGGIYMEPRMVLEKIPGIRLKEMRRNKRWSYCCGSGGKISSVCHPEMAARSTRDRLEEGKDAGNTIVTACTTCAVHMDRFAGKENLKVEILDLPLLVAEAMGVK